jgi:hypothetical protein
MIFSKAYFRSLVKQYTHIFPSNQNLSDWQALPPIFFFKHFWTRLEKYTSLRPETIPVFASGDSYPKNGIAPKMSHSIGFFHAYLAQRATPSAHAAEGSQIRVLA